jgi:NADPH:quinone reductase-like Zn-dependent oxidoreductase
MKVLFIGGTGNISLAVTQLAAARGIELTLLRRGQRAADLPEGVGTIVADIRMKRLLQRRSAIGTSTLWLTGSLLLRTRSRGT